jgi:hypothetical protein
MKKASMLLALGFLSAANISHAEWKKLAETKSTLFYYDTSSFGSFRGQPTLWMKTMSKATPRDGYKKAQFTANCSERRLFVLVTLKYDSNDNQTVSEKQYEDPYEFVVSPDSINEDVYNKLCKKR